jgi:hypothetical protein
MGGAGGHRTVSARAEPLVRYGARAKRAAPVQQTGFRLWAARPGKCNERAEAPGRTLAGASAQR